MPARFQYKKLPRLPDHKKMIGDGMELLDLEEAIKNVLFVLSPQERYTAKHNKVNVTIESTVGTYVITGIKIKGDNLVLHIAPEF